MFSKIISLTYLSAAAAVFYTTSLKWCRKATTIVTNKKDINTTHNHTLHTLPGLLRACSAASGVK